MSQDLLKNTLPKIITKHRYINNYPIPPDSKKLIVGTIHPHPNEEKPFKVDFFYGNENTIWRILNEAYPNEISSTQGPTIAEIEKFLLKHKIAVTDTICECERLTTPPTALDKDLLPTVLNHGILGQIKNSQINEIFFTSGFGKNNAFKLFYEKILELKLTPEIKLKRGGELDDKRLGRKIKLTLLYSPSPSANRGIIKSKIYKKNQNKYKDSQKPVHAFKVDYYREQFNLAP